MYTPTIEEIVDHNRFEVDVTGEPHFVRDMDTLESAVRGLQMRVHYEPYLDSDDDRSKVIRTAVRLATLIAQRQCFVQGNKRTAAQALVQTIEMNGYEFEMPNDDTLADIILSIANNEYSEDEFCDAIDHAVL